MTHKKKAEETQSDSKGHTEDESLVDLAETVVETFQETYKGVTDPFEYYVYSVRSHIYSNTKPSYTNRFVEGYQTLLHEIEEPKNDEK